MYRGHEYRCVSECAVGYYLHGVLMAGWLLSMMCNYVDKI